MFFVSKAKLQDIRAYREAQLKPTGIEPLFPLWKLPTAALARDMIEGGLRAKLTCVDTKQLADNFVGREFDIVLLQDLPTGGRPVRRARRVSHLRICGADV
jgi:diphthamide synthase (EF-2-diphthine--ammonia ligase)